MGGFQGGDVLASEFNVEAVFLLLQHSDLLDQPIIVPHQPFYFTLNRRAVLPLCLHVHSLLLNTFPLLIQHIPQLLNLSLIALHLFGLGFEFGFDLNVLFTQLLVLFFKLNYSVIHFLRLTADFGHSLVFLLRALEELTDLLCAGLMDDVGVGLRLLEFGLATDTCLLCSCAMGLLHELLIYWLQFD